MANWPRSIIRLASDGQQNDCSHLRTEADERGAADTLRTGAIDRASVHDLMSQGYTFVGSRYEYASPTLADLCADLNAHLNVRTTTMLFASLSLRFMVLVNLSSGKPARREVLADYLGGGDMPPPFATSHRPR